ncbi:MAG: alcohol dehydrogenase catalytic domain-containing protein [Corallococcus sp.]|nr:alcohol dehydrogenase catalytic domain-containing protein [Corallococcus sp.]MCM1359991.1 alcohol dehydrogenase catalytic domain-containing protein [Corallococcus sp.]MCM1395548.1 alcohol dehydrogenase catalytic domain-containing protein [Corallococcus sp.]
MKSWKLNAPNTLVLEESEPTILTENLVKVKIEEALLSTTDVEMVRSASKTQLPIVPGRNAVGVVSEVFDREKSMLQKMDRVTIEPYVPCESCWACAKGDFDKCCDMKYMGQNCDGLFRDFVTVPAEQVHHLPDNISNEQALFVPYVAFGINIVDALNVEKGTHVAIFASTKTGIILAQLIAYYQAVPVLVSGNEDLLNVARSLGIFYCVNTEQTDVEKEIRTVTGGRMCKALVLFSDSEFSMKDLYSAAATNATICLAGSSNKDSRLSIAQICQKHLTIFCVYNGVGNFASAINLLVTGTVKVDQLVGDAIGFDDLADALDEIKPEDLALKSKIVKVD